jgi:peptidylprolyl isomerase
LTLEINERENKVLKKRNILLLTAVLLGAVLFLAGCAAKPATAKSGDKVKVDYTLTVDGKVYDTSVGKTPFEFTLGTNAVIPGFEKAVLGMKVGDKKTVNITAADGYGARDESKVFVVQPTDLPQDATPAVGMQLQGTNTDGSVSSFTITKIDSTGITLDGNSPLAGKDLTFEITLLAIETTTGTTTGTNAPPATTTTTAP